MPNEKQRFGVFFGPTQALDMDGNVLRCGFSVPGSGQCQPPQRSAALGLGLQRLPAKGSCR